MDSLAQVNSYVQAYVWGGAMSVVQLLHISELTLMIRPGDAILDLACGPGPLLLELAAIYPESKFIGADLSPLMLQHLEQDTRTRELKSVSVFRDDMRTLLSLQDTKVDLVITTSALHHLPDEDSLRQVPKPFLTSSCAFADLFVSFKTQSSTQQSSRAQETIDQMWRKLPLSLKFEYFMLRGLRRNAHIT